jgi:predicted nucleic-acid-binding protein
MIGLDTNIILRYLVQDDPVQSSLANEVMERRLTEAEPGFVSVVVMAEIVRVLGSRYRFAARHIVAAIERMLSARTLVIEREYEVHVAMIALKDGRGSFADALIGALAAGAGCRQTLTFDQKATRLPGFALP